MLVNEDQSVPLEVGSCITIGVRTCTKGIDASDTPLVDGPVQVIADSPMAGEPNEESNGTPTPTSTPDTS